MAETKLTEQQIASLIKLAILFKTLRSNLATSNDSSPSTVAKIQKLDTELERIDKILSIVRSENNLT